LDADWVLEARDEHRERLIELHERLAQEADQRGDLEGALRHSRKQVHLEPMSEQAVRRLMNRLAASGDLPAALAAYKGLAERLREELRVAPSAETQALARRLRAGAGETRQSHQAEAPQPPLPGPLRRSERSVFVGRDDATKQLIGALEATLRGEA